jgi:two-component system, response regulator RegA
MTQEANGRLLLIDDETATRRALRRSLAGCGWETECAGNMRTALAVAARWRPARAVLSLELRSEPGLPVISTLMDSYPDIRIVALTRRPSIAAAVDTIRRGAVHYLAKPVNADDILAAFRQAAGNSAVPIPDRPMSLLQLEWEHLQHILLRHDGNISAAARSLSMHRRTLQRKLLRLAPG